MNEFFSRGIAGDDVESQAETPKKRDGHSGAKLERKAAKGCVGMATLR